MPSPPSCAAFPRPPQDEPRFNRGVDEGTLAAGHANATERFLDDKLKSGGVFALQKAERMVEELEATRRRLASDARETEISERIQRDVTTHRKALAKGYREGELGENSAVQGFDRFVLPTLGGLVEQLRAGCSEQEALGTSHDLLRGYAPYYAPNQLRTRWNHDAEALSLFKPAVAPRRVKKHDPRALEASNLIVEEGNQSAISAQLGASRPVGHYLSPEETATLKQKGFDLSLIHPGVSGYWHRTTMAEVEEKRNRFLGMFPTPTEKLTFEAPRYRSDYSTKLTASFVRDGVKHRLKIKLGEEVHGDLISTRLREYMGFFQDQMMHRDEILLHLGDKTFETFERELSLKYGTGDLRRTIARRGIDPKTGEEWVVFKDSALELRPSEEIRATAVELGVYDGTNRRELRSRVLLQAFLGLGDSTPKNHRMVFAKTQDGSYQCEYRFQDLGRSLGRVTVLQGARDALNFPFTRNKIQEYDRRFVSKNKRGDIALVYNDTFGHVRDYRDATYADLKWMARVIASVSSDAIERSVRESGIPEALVPIYCHHITRMKNRVIDAFELGADTANIPGAPPVERTELPALKAVNTGDAVVRGKIVKNAFPGKMILPTLQETWFTFLNSKLSLVTKQSFVRQVEQSLGPTEFKASAVSFLDVEQSLGATILEDRIPTAIGKASLGPGITASVARIVSPNPQLFSSEGKARPYVVHDAVSFSIGVSSGFLRHLGRWFSPELAPKLQLLRATIRHVRYAETVKAGYAKAPLLHRAIFGNLERFAIDHLEPGEVVGFEWAGGLDVGLSAKLDLGMPGPSTSFLKNGVSGALAWVRGSGTTYAKDTWGALHLLLERSQEMSASVGIDAMNANLVQLRGALGSLHALKSETRQEYWNIEVVPPQYDMERGAAALEGFDPTTLASSLAAARRAPAQVEKGSPTGAREPGVQLKYHVRARRSASAVRAQGLFLFNRDRARERVDFRVETPGTAYDLLRLSTQKRALAGFEDLLVDLSAKNLMVQEGTSKKVTLEMDRLNPRGFVVTLDVYDYHRTLPREGVGLLLDKLNRRYSKSASEAFFRTDLPPSEQKYRKIYANARIYVNGDKLLRAIEERVPEALEALIRRALGAAVRERAGVSTAKAMLDGRDRRGVVARALEAARRLEAASRSLALAVMAEPGTPAAADRERREDALAVAAFDLVYALYKSKYGVSVLRDVLGEDGIFVVGEVFGIHHQTSMLQEDMWKNTLRFAGKSWGKLTKVPPVSHYVRYEQSTPPNAHALPRIPIERFVGTPVRGVPGNFIGFGER